MVVNKPLDSIQETDLQTLIDNQVSEGKTIEYKDALPGNADGDKKEFLADVSSFANAAGGDLIFGVKEEAGVPIELCGLDISDIDAEILRLESIIQTGIAPRLFRLVEIHPVLLPSKKFSYVIIIRIRRSWTGPHVVTFKNDSKFFTRNSRGKYQLDVFELRTAFTLSETTTERIKNFRTDRLNMIVAGEGPVPLRENDPKLVLHMVPFAAFDPALQVDLSLLTDISQAHLLRSMKLHNGAYGAARFNFDGLLCDLLLETYVQVFRNGSIEAVDTTILGASRDLRITTGDIYEGRLLESAKRFLAIQKQLGIEAPLFIMISFLGVKGFKIGFNSPNSGVYGVQDHVIDRTDLVLPEIMVEDFDSELTEVMKPAFDIIANAAGWRRSMSYNEDGRSLLTDL